jgi:pyruvate formate lyase activating enzyme
MRATAPADTLQIAGLARLSTCDWPGHLVATAFLQGCPLACGYCHNPGILDPRVPGTLAWREVLELLGRRRGLLDGVVFSGGEPTRQPALADAMREVREFGFGVGLHTAGPYPRTFARVLPLCDWIGLDIKAPKRLYGRVTGVASAGEKAFACLRMALEAGVALQVRTTVDPTTMTEDDVAELGATLHELGVTEHVLQEVRLEGVRQEYRDLVPESALRTGRSVEAPRTETT